MVAGDNGGADSTPEKDERPDADATSPTRIRSLAVTTTDVVDALEARVRRQRRIVLRVTPPFSGRMRARIHDAGVVDEADTETSADHDAGPNAEYDTEAGADHDAGHSAASPLSLPPERFVDAPPAYPTVDETEDELRASATTYTRERHQNRHREAVEAWREAVRERLVDSVTIPTETGPHTVTVSYLS
jgi:hypothetical protein